MSWMSEYYEDEDEEEQENDPLIKALDNILDIDDIPDDSEFNIMFKKKFKEMANSGGSSFSFMMDENDHCYEMEEEEEDERDVFRNEWS